MISVKRFYLTGADGKRYSGTIDFYQYQGEDIFSFRFDFSGDRFNVKKNETVWCYGGGMESYLNSWVSELGLQIEATAHL
ncbi:hypothetical protein [Mucilaginibacter flavus]|uniref:hypothetical protein n=1 Tax=Mucilaginibacter flavus TaxID=931504 RepID=UPI0025B3AE51|nr:hypothetical protein [Mucilaginibacter flavus]MDN3580369.1 hypothetical protein [Mucilaginibacter flavus]